MTEHEAWQEGFDMAWAVHKQMIKALLDRCDQIHTASAEWDVSARPGGFIRCCEVRALLLGETNEESTDGPPPVG